MTMSEDEDSELIDERRYINNNHASEQVFGEGSDFKLHAGGQGLFNRRE